jgi:hypothetical protein
MFYGRMERYQRIFALKRGRLINIMRLILAFGEISGYRYFGVRSVNINQWDGCGGRG